MSASQYLERSLLVGFASAEVKRQDQINGSFLPEEGRVGRVEH